MAAAHSGAFSFGIVPLLDAGDAAGVFAPLLLRLPVFRFAMSNVREVDGWLQKWKMDGWIVSRIYPERNDLSGSLNFDLSFSIRLVNSKQRGVPSWSSRVQLILDTVGADGSKECQQQV